MIKKILKVSAIISAVIVGLWLLLYVFCYVLCIVDTKQISKNYPTSEIRINHKDYRCFSSYDYNVLFREEARNSIGTVCENYGWTIKLPAVRVKDNVFSSDYYIYADNTDIIIGTDEMIYIRNGASLPESPLMKTVKSITVYNRNTDSCFTLTSDYAYKFLMILCDDSNTLSLSDLQSLQYLNDSKNETITFDFVAEYTELKDINAEGVVYVFSSSPNNNRQCFATDSDGNLYLFNNGKIKPIPSDLAKIIIKNIY